MRTIGRLGREGATASATAEVSGKRKSAPTKLFELTTATEYLYRQVVQNCPALGFAAGGSGILSSVAITSNAPRIQIMDQIEFLRVCITGATVPAYRTPAGTAHFSADRRSELCQPVYQDAEKAKIHLLTRAVLNGVLAVASRYRTPTVREGTQRAFFSILSSQATIVVRQQYPALLARCQYAFR
jgi:hypothetical protein